MCLSDSCYENVIVNFINHEDDKIYNFFPFRSSAENVWRKTKGNTYRNHNIMHIKSSEKHFIQNFVRIVVSFWYETIYTKR